MLELFIKKCFFLSRPHLRAGEALGLQTFFYCTPTRIHLNEKTGNEKKIAAGHKKGCDERVCLLISDFNYELYDSIYNADSVGFLPTRTADNIHFHAPKFFLYCLLFSFSFILLFYIFLCNLCLHALQKSRKSYKIWFNCFQEFLFFVSFLSPSKIISCLKIVLLLSFFCYFILLIFSVCVYIFFC